MDPVLSGMFTMVFDSQRGVRVQNADGDWTDNMQAWLTAVPCSNDRPREIIHEQQWGAQYESSTTDIVNCAPGTDVIRGDWMTVRDPRGVVKPFTARVTEVRDAAMRGNHTIVHLDRRGFGG